MTASFLLDAPHLILHVHLQQRGFRVTDSSGSVAFYQEQWDEGSVHGPQLTIHGISVGIRTGMGGDAAPGGVTDTALVPLAKVSWLRPLSSVITVYNVRARRRLHMNREVPFSSRHTVAGPSTMWHWKRRRRRPWATSQLRLVDRRAARMLATLVYHKSFKHRYRAGHLATLKIGASAPPECIDEIVVTALAKLTYQRIHLYYTMHGTKPTVAQIAGVAKPR
ncbi:extracellular membrane protein, CFEM domain-containingprotein [Purpureocillium lavendulum]|uniref:Extracellular membrane protein, CFEM domain-containingprotein n=1 Tax=Purpureocillium lavendulum TaxID=1247861 RepID=A0AB34FWW4_9HYPO|nr:extracellular membrane protein, CFEM domain-containingprotein [Purpureocillium lavendulum]